MLKGNRLLIRNDRHRRPYTVSSAPRKRLFLLGFLMFRLGCAALLAPQSAHSGCPASGRAGGKSQARWGTHPSPDDPLPQARPGHTEVPCKTMKNPERYRHLRVDWVGESSRQSITLCGNQDADIGTGQPLCPECARVSHALNVCGLGPESLRELFETLRKIGPYDVKAKMEALRGLGVQMDTQDRAQLN